MSEPMRVTYVIARLNECAKYDTETGHIEADKIIGEFLTSLGYGDVTEAWEKLPKWYA